MRAECSFPSKCIRKRPDKRVSISHPQGGSSVTAFNGEVGWLSIRNGVHMHDRPGTRSRAH